MTANTSLLLSNPDFASIRAGLVAFLKSQDRFKDYNFAGSNISVLLDLLAYNSYQDAFFTSMAASEMFLDTAQLRESIISHAKELGYNPRSVTAAKAVVSVEVIPTDNPGTLVIPAGQVFTTNFGSRAMTFQTIKPHLVTPSNGRWIANEVEIYEGFLITDVFTIDGTLKQKLVLSNANIDTNTLSVTVNDSIYSIAKTLLDLKPSSSIFFAELDSTGSYNITFGDGVFGRQPEYQSVVKASYLVSLGAAANDALVFRCASSISGYSNIVVATIDPASGGADAESTESIRRNAPQLFQSRNRAVTANDYKVLLMDKFPEIVSVNVYGGEELTPAQYGKVFICANVTGSTATQNTAKTRYLNYVKDRSPITIQPVLVDPQVVKLKLTSKVYFDYINNNVTGHDIESSVLNAITTFSQTLVTFNSTFALSQLVANIDKSSSAIISNDTDVLMSFDVNIAELETDTQKLYFRNPLTTKCNAVSSTMFHYNNTACTIKDDEEGLLNIVSGETIITRIGTVEYETGIVTIDSFIPQLVAGNSLTVYAQTESKNISASQNMLLSIDLAAVSITSVPSIKSS